MNVSLIDGHIDDDVMTDEQIIKALECCVDEYIHSCDYCLFEKERDDDNLNLVKYALALVNRQKAEISVLRKLLDKAETELNNQSENMKKLTKDAMMIPINAINKKEPNFVRSVFVV